MDMDRTGFGVPWYGVSPSGALGGRISGVFTCQVSHVHAASILQRGSMMV